MSKKTLLIVGSQKDYVKLNSVKKYGIEQVIDMSQTEFEKLEFDTNNLIIMKGATETKNFMKPIIQLNKKVGGGSLSYCAVFQKVHNSEYAKKLERSFILTDAAIIMYPDLEMKKNMTRNAVGLLKRLRMGKPVINFMTPEHNNEKFKSVIDAKQLKEFFDKEEPKWHTSYFSRDVCFSARVRRAKGITCVKRPNILIYHDIEVANQVFKELTANNRHSVAGFVVGNDKLPLIIMNSRGDTLASKRLSIEYAAKTLVQTKIK